ncbi:MAG: D-2-hydroxyacid dehydrogenase [Clostridia bacterium]|nr:D-2-hydroxyacid dehydrogenase [Clostridia bacterium]
MKLLMTGAFNCTNEQKLNMEKLGCEVVFQQMENEPLSAEMFQAEAIICNGLFLYNDLDKFPNLKFVQLTSAGLDRVFVERMTEKGIKLCNARGVYSTPMAEWALTGVLSLYKQTKAFYENQKNHKWNKIRNIKELSDSTVCIVGCGSVGTECAKLFKPFSSEIVAVDIVKPISDLFDSYYTINNVAKAVENADVVILTLPLTDETQNLFNKELLSHFKNDAILVNIARGAIVNENDLTDALKNGTIGGAVLDVFNEEPLSEKSELWNMDNVIITPHNSFASQKNVDRLCKVVYNNLKKYIEGDENK